MLKFIRRLFILLVLFLVVFLVYRYINPDGASRLVDKIKAMPDNISSMLGLEKKDNIKVESETTSISGDVDIIENSENDLDDDLSWLESLNKEIEGILGKDKTGVVVDESFLEDTTKKTESINTGTIVVTGNIVNTGISTTIVTGNTVKTGTTTNTNTTKKPTNKLSDSDYKQIKDVFGNLIE